MRRWICTWSLIGALAAPAWAQAPEPGAKPAEPAEPISAADTVLVTVFPGAAKNTLRLEVFVVNSDSVAGMPVPLRVTAEGSKVTFDSVSYAGGRTNYFQLKSQNADSANQTLLLGLIADLSGSKPPLAPGRGLAFTLFYSTDKPVNPDKIRVVPVVLPPANKLEFNVYRDGVVSGIRPTFIQKTGQIEQKPQQPKGGVGKG